MVTKNKLKKIDEAWLGLDNLETELFNPMSMLHATDDDFNLKLAFLMTSRVSFFYMQRSVEHTTTAFSVIILKRYGIENFQC